MRRRQGFSVVEVLVVFSILVILVRFAIPRYNHMRKQAQARAAVADVRVLRDALFNFHQDRNSWPNESGPGNVPQGLQTYLPGGFDFLRGSYTIDYEAWGAVDGASANAPVPGTAALVAVAIDTPDADLVTELRKLANLGIPYVISGSRTTFILDGLSGVS